MTKLTKYLIAYHYLRKMKKTGGIWRIHYADSGSVYIQRRNGRGKYKDKVRISEHLPTNRHGNIKSSQSNKKIYITIYSLFRIQRGL